MLCTSGVMDDVTFGRNGPYGDSGGAMPGWSLMSMNALCLFKMRSTNTLIRYHTVRCFSEKDMKLGAEHLLYNWALDSCGCRCDCSRQGEITESCEMFSGSPLSNHRMMMCSLTSAANNSLCYTTQHS